MAYNPGRMRDRIQVYARTLSSVGDVTIEVWTTLYATLWAQAEEMRGTKLMEAGAYTDIGQAKFWIRDTTTARAITPTGYRIVWNGKTWNIQSNVPLAIERGLREVYCVEWVKE